MRAVSLVSLSLVLSSAVHAQQQVLQAGTQYPAGTRVSSPLTGVSFVVPEGFRGQYDAEATAVLMRAEGGDRQDLVVGIYALSQASPDDIAGVVSNSLEAQGLQLTVRGTPLLTDSTASAWSFAIDEERTVAR